MTLAGLPATTLPAGTSRVTTLPAAMTAPAPIDHALQNQRVHADEDIIRDGNRRGVGGQRVNAP